MLTKRTIKRPWGCKMIVCAIVLIANLMVLLLFSSNAHAGELDLRPIEIKPEPLSNLHPKLKWMREDKVRGVWIGDDLFDKFPESEKTKGQVLADAGFNMVYISMVVNSDNTQSGVVDTSKPYELKVDRTKSTDIETRLASNVSEAKRVGLQMMVIWKYGTHHLEPYRKYRSPTEGLAKYTCCPIEEAYITGQHTGKWAVKIAKGGADGMAIDTEMYHSDKADYLNPCVCDDCFATYLKQYATDWHSVYDSVPADQRGKWLVNHKALDTFENTWWDKSHYATFAARRIEKLWDGVRRRCQAINPTFFFGVAPMLQHIPGMERGLGTASVPCLVFSEHEYYHGAYRWSFIGTQQIRESLPALFLSGAYVFGQTPDEMANNSIQSSLYTDGWWAYYGTALLQDNLPDGYGRFGTTSKSDYLDSITAAHLKIDELLTLPKSKWPKRQDGKLNWLKKHVTEAESDLAEKESDLTKAKDRLVEVKVDLDNYKKYGVKSVTPQ